MPCPVADRISPFGYSLAGTLLIVHAECMRGYDAGCWWALMGFALVVQGVVSYASDVAGWGHHDCLARRIDPMMASVLFVFFGPVLGARSALGLFAIPASTIGIWLVGCVLALGCRCMGARASRRGRGGALDASCSEIMGWHVGWHALPLVACFCVLDLVHVWTF